MILCCCFGNKKSAMCDLYKDLVNDMSKKGDIIAIIPSAYTEEEFSDNLVAKIKENLTEIENKKKRLFYMMKYLFELKQIFSKYDITKVYFQNDAFIYNSIIYMACGLNVKYTIWLHDPVLHEGATRMERFYRKCSIHTHFHKVKRFIISYNAAMKDVISSPDLNRYAKKMKTIFLPQMKEMEFQDIRVKSKDIKYDYIFYGRIEEYKGLEMFIDAFLAFNDEKNLLIIGTGRDEENVKKKISNNPRITFINRYVSNRDLAEYIMESKCVVLPYKSATGSQTVAIANYYNRIVMATKVGCFPEYVEEGKNGFFIEDYTVEAMKKAIQKSDYYVDMCTPDKIASVYKKFDIHKISDELYQEIKA